jgi:hypothetical protein
MILVRFEICLKPQTIQTYLRNMKCAFFEDRKNWWEESLYQIIVISFIATTSFPFGFKMTLEVTMTSESK